MKIKLTYLSIFHFFLGKKIIKELKKHKTEGKKQILLLSIIKQKRKHSFDESCPNHVIKIKR